MITEEQLLETIQRISSLAREAVLKAFREGRKINMMVDRGTRERYKDKWIHRELDGSVCYKITIGPEPLPEGWNPPIPYYKTDIIDPALANRVDQELKAKPNHAVEIFIPPMDDRPSMMIWPMEE